MPKPRMKMKFRTWEEALGWPMDRISTGQARANHSKAYETILKAVKDSGGWSFREGKTSGAWYYVVLAGPFTGTYIFSTPYVKWEPRFYQPYGSYPTTLGLRKVRAARMKVLYDFAAQVMQIPDVLRFINDPSVWTEKGWEKDTWEQERDNRGAHLMSEERVRELRSFIDSLPVDARGRLDLDADISDEDKVRYRRAKDELGIRRGRERSPTEKQVAVRSKDPAAYAAKVAEAQALILPPVIKRLYILAQSGGVPLARIVRDLQEQPRRILSVPSSEEWAIPTSAKERSKFSKVLLETWSGKKAWKAIYPNVEGYIEGPPERSTSTTKYALNYLPSWRQLEEMGRKRVEAREAAYLEGLRQRLQDTRQELEEAEREKAPFEDIQSIKEDVRFLTERIELLERGPEKLPAGQPNSLLRFAEQFKAIGVKAAEWKGIVQTFLRSSEGWDQAQLLVDTLHNLPLAREGLAETVEGRRVLDAYDRKDWPTLIRAHDQVAELADEAEGEERRSITEEEAVAWHEQAAQARLPSGVKALIQRADFKAEGKEMEHCVPGYFWQRRSFCFAFQAPDGTRATLEWDPFTTRVNQFYGPKNENPSRATLYMLGEFKALNPSPLPVKSPKKQKKKRRRALLPRVVQEQEQAQQAAQNPRRARKPRKVLSQRAPLTCTKCRKSFKGEAGLRWHRRNAH